MPDTPSTHPRPAAEHTAPPGPPAPAKVSMASAVGATIEWYDFFLYGTAAGLVFDKLFFNGLDGPAAQFAAFGTFAVGFFARPIGGLVFGHFGDRVGRKKMLILTLLIMGVGTAAIGLLPTYDQIGVWAPILLVTLRVLQGIGVGGEYGGAVLLAVEYAPAERRGFFGSFAHVGVPAGLLLASGAFSIASLLPDEAFLAWGWRACFLLSVALLAVGAYIRLSVMETPAFAKVQERKEVSTLPVRDLLRTQPGRVVLAMGTRYIEGFTFNLFSVYLLAYAVTNLELPKSLALNGIMVGALLGAILVVVTGSALRPARPQARLPGRRLGGAVLRVPGRRADAERGLRRGVRRVRGRPRAVRRGLRAAGGVLVGAVRHLLPLHGPEHRLPGLGHPRLRPHAAHRRLAGDPGRRHAVVGRRLQRAGRRHQPGVDALPARDRAAATSTSRPPREDRSADRDLVTA